jgi:glycosyltransferase involved in cell wall biosynthesis
MNWIFLDGIPWDYDIETPLVRPLGGSQSCLCYLAAALARRGHGVTALTGTTSPRVVQGVQCLGLREIPRAVFEVPSSIVVVLNGPADMVTQLRPAIPPTVPLVLWAHHATDQPAMQPLRNPTCPAQWDRILCVSPWQAATFVQELGVPAERIEVLHDAIAPGFERMFQSASELELAKAGPPRLAYTSTPFRGLDLLLACFPAIRREHPDCRLDVFSSMLVYGMPDSQDAYQALYAHARAMEGVEYHGSVSQPELARHMARVSVLAYPNTFAETCCIAALEALAAGALVVTSDLGALRDTCAGYGRLIAPLAPQRTPELFALDFVIAVCAALTELKRDRSAFAARQFAQANHFNAVHTWDLRAAEIESAAARWLAQRRP